MKALAGSSRSALPRAQAIATILFFSLAGSKTNAAPTAESQRIDLTHYFASPAAEVEDRQVLERDLATLQALQEKIDTSAGTLLQALQLHDQILSRYGRHDDYLLLLCRSNRKDAEACQADDALLIKVEAARAAFGASLGKVAPATLKKFIAAEPRLAAFRYEMERFARAQEHGLSPNERKVVAALAPQISGWQDDLYEEAVARADFGSVVSAHGALDVRRQRNLIAVDPDPKVRAEGFRKRYAALLPERETIAFSLLHVAQAGNQLAQMRGFENAPNEKYFSLELEPARVRALIAEVTVQGELYQHFERIRIADLKRKTGPDEAGPWDMSFPTMPAPHWSLAQARTLLHDVFASFSDVYARQFDALLNPANGRADLLPGGAPNRSSGGFSLGHFDATSALFVGNYDGTYKDLSVIAHEGGHAVHRALMSESKAPVTYREGPHFLFESFAEFNELLLADYLARQAKDPAARRYYEERFLAVKGLDFLLGADDAALEQAIYDGVAAKRLATADDLDALTAKIDRPFSLWPDKWPLLKSRWEHLSLAFEDPLYNVNYMYASMLALRYFQLYQERPEWFVKQYLSLLGNGFTAPPEQLLKQFLAVDLADDALLKKTVSVVQSRLAALEKEKPQ